MFRYHFYLYVLSVFYNDAYTTTSYIATLCAAYIYVPLKSLGFQPLKLTVYHVLVYLP